MPRHALALLLTLAATLSLAGLLAAAPPADEPSALQRDPSGWTDLLVQAGPDLKGWTRVPIPPGSTLKAESPWSLDPASGHLLCRGEGVHEMLLWDQELGDFIYHVEWRFFPVTEGKKAYNSGVYARNSADGKIWHQAQTGNASGGFLFGDTPVDGQIQRVNLSKQVKEKRVRPAGEWNTYEITCKGKDMILWTNGAVTCEWHECEVSKGHVGLEAEGYRIEFRNVKVKPLR
ncbi:MAG: DUF1080 domain-containing protein [Isosphaeraceae bacterium]|nr:DUF1080 domain-containing protein [Isosphaeraceae bacterium]